jgi:large conductance mechanosensitive channel
MRKLWAEFKAIAVGGNVLDLALGFIIGTAFAALLQSFVSHIFLQFIAAIIGKRNFNDLVVPVERTPIQIGSFLTDLLNFILLAVALFFVVKLMHWLGIERGRAFVQQTCPYCFDRVPAGAFVCRSCSQPLVEELPDLADARRMLAQREARKWPTIPAMPVKPPNPLKPLKPRRKEQADDRSEPSDSAEREA